jgi:ligand-binding sensor domain-containing protein
MYRQLFYFRLPGHIPPPPNQPWKATEMQAAEVWLGIGDCRAQAYSEGTLIYGSQAECRAFRRAEETLVGLVSGATAALDVDGSLWRVDVVRGPDGNGQTLLEHIKAGQPKPLEIPGHFLYALASDPTHGVWIGTDKGLVYSDGTRLRWITFGLDACAIPAEMEGTHNLAVDAQGTAWAATRAGVYALSPGELDWRLVPDSSQAAARPVWAIAAAPGGGIWASHGYDLFRLGGATTPEPVQPPDARCLMQSLAADLEFVWFSRSPTSGASVCDLMQWVISAQAWAYHPVPKGYLVHAVVGSDRTVYALGPEGLYVRVVMGPRSEFRPVGAKGADLIAADKQGGVWVASRATGWIWHYANGKLTPHGQEFYGDALQQLTVDSRNRLWAALNEALSVYDNSWRSIATPLHQIRELTSGPDGRIWIVGDIGIAVYNPAASKQP